MIISDFDIMGIGADPSEADPPLVIDTDAVLSPPVAAQGLQSVRWRNPEVCKGLSIIQHSELPACDFLNLRRQALGPFPMPDHFSVFRPEAPNHIEY